MPNPALSIRSQSQPEAAEGRILRRRFKLPALLGGAGGLGLLACAACCALPILGAIGVGTGAMAFFRILEPLSVTLLAIGAAAGVVTLVLLRRHRCAGGAARRQACAADGSCGCGPSGETLSGAAER